jgi:hypothetical protein
MGRLNPQRRAALKQARAAQYAMRMVLDAKNEHAVKSHAVDSCMVMDLFNPVGATPPNSRGWEFSSAPKGSVKAAGHMRDGTKIGKPGIRLVMPSKGKQRFARD